MLPYLVALFVLVWLAAFALEFVYRAKLRVVAPEIAATITPWYEASKGLNNMRFLIGGGFRAIHDPAFVRFCEAYRVLVLSMWLLLIIVPAVLITHA